MTKELLENQIKELKDTLENELNKIQPLRNEIMELEEALLQLRLRTELITDLTPYNNKNVRHIRAFDSDYEEVYLPTETIEITHGHLDCTGFNEGIVYYSDEVDGYVKCVYGTEHPLNIIGFLDIEVSD